MLTLACALAYTYIVATRSAFVNGVSAETAQQGLSEYGGSPLEYRRNGRAIASVVFLWPGMVFTFVRLVIPPLTLACSVLISTQHILALALTRPYRRPWPQIHTRVYLRRGSQARHREAS
jgi:hypothetical protein